MTDWKAEARNILRAELARRGKKTKDLQISLAQIGVHKNYHNLVTTIAKGSFSFAFFLQCLEALDITWRFEDK